MKKSLYLFFALKHIKNGSESKREENTEAKLSEKKNTEAKRSESKIRKRNKAKSKIWKRTKWKEKSGKPKEAKKVFMKCSRKKFEAKPAHPTINPQKFTTPAYKKTRGVNGERQH
jgi:hypothetical protein